ncbi:MAG: class I SAM-dependent methyltransferase [Candidatus Omnitrophica bacterium]|nr:class I SAM-dependent methyltransferase [Candidatus Omnitrophota bacterium]
MIGNPPWVTNAEIGSLNGDNLPKKSNFKGMRGIEALTGRSNFDLAEFILLKIIAECEGENALIAFLCKTAVARSVLVHAQRTGLRISDCEIRRIDAKKWFSASADACLFILELGCSTPSYQAAVYSSLQANHPERIMAVVDGNLIADMETYESIAMLDGSCPIQWRQGVKHDAAPVLELIHVDNEWRNGLGETIDVEDCFIYPLMKGSDIGGAGGPTQRERGVILTQCALGEDTHDLEVSAPRLWSYLMRHRGVFARRRSSIYRGKPPFSIFGVGPYSFSSYKVLVSGLHKEPRFMAVGRQHGKPILCDDTCYLLPCESGLQCALISTLLNHSLTRQFLESISFQDSKRPMTKAILSRIDISALASLLSWEDILEDLECTLSRIGEATDVEPWFSSDLTSALSLPNSPDQELLFTR